MKDTKILTLLVLLNISYWGFSEVYMGNGLFFMGAAYGFVVSLFSLVVGVVFGLLIRGIS